MAVPLLIALKTIAEIGAAVQAVNGAYNFFEDKVKDVDKSQIILETVRRQMAQYQAEMEEQALIMKERKAFLEAEGRDTSSVAYVNAKTDYDNARNKYFATEAQLAKLRNQEATLLAQLSHREQINNYMPQPSADFGQGYGGGYGMLAGAQAVDYNKMVSENKNFAERNRLMYEAKPINEQYIADMQKIIDEENEFGTTIEKQAEKIDIYNRRLNELAGEKTKLQDFMKTLQDDFDSEIVKNSELMSAIGYDTSAADDVKAARIAANKETISSVKELSSLLSLMAEIENKIKNLDEEQRSVQQNLKSMYVSKKTEDIYAQKMLTMQNEYAIKAKALGTPLNSDEQRRATVAQIEYLKQVMIEQEQQIYNWEKELQSDKAKNDMAEYHRIKNLLDAEKVLRAEHAGQMRDLEYQKNAQIREGLAGIAVDFFIQGNTLRSIWSNLWKDLAREAIQRLFKVKAEASLLGLVLGLFGGKEKLPAAIGVTTSGITNGGSITVGGITVLSNANMISDAVISSNAIGTMHSGGNVMSGRIGVVPALKDDEVLRTLQVGEEVNSIRDRRSNEILATVAMRAMDNTAKAPTQVIITALDSRSFAEYLNENSDILQAVLSKNNAMGRRA
jgi:glycerol-3-phosphate cytidylyltransferase-like family protein